MKFRFYITDIGDGKIMGTDDESIARDFAQCDDYFVVDAETGTWLTYGGDEEIKKYEQPRWD